MTNGNQQGVIFEPEIDALRSPCEPHGDGLNNDDEHLQ